MSEDLAERVAYLEREARRTTYAIDGVDKRTDFRLQEINLHLDTQDKKLEAFSESVDKRFDVQDKKLEAFSESVDKRLEAFKESVDERFEHVYGQLADVNANIIDVRNMLASFIAKNY